MARALEGAAARGAARAAAAAKTASASWEGSDCRASVAGGSPLATMTRRAMCARAHSSLRAAQRPGCVGSAGQRCQRRKGGVANGRSGRVKAHGDGCTFTVSPVEASLRGTWAGGIYVPTDPQKQREIADASKRARVATSAHTRHGWRESEESKIVCASTSVPSHVPHRPSDQHHVDVPKQCK